MLAKRFLTSIVCIPMIIFVLTSYDFFCPSAVLLVSCIGIFEFYKAAKVDSKFLFSLGFITSCFMNFGHASNLKISIFPMLLSVWCGLFYFLFVKKHKTNDVFLSIFGIIYISYMMSYITLLKKFSYFGKYFVWLIFLGAFSTDIFAYFGGKTFGRRKLMPKTSPNKTIEGATFGVLGSIITFIVFGSILKKTFNIEISVLKISLLGLLSAIFAQIGDAVASTIKRKCDIKDFGNILPGHGGILDRLDSLIFTAPLIYFFIFYIGILK